MSSERTLQFNNSEKISAGISETGGDAADGCGDGAIDFGRVFAGALAAQHVDLDQVHGIDVWVAQLME